MKKIKVNALLDDKYKKSDVAYLGLQGQLQKVKGSVLNGHIEAFETSLNKCIKSASITIITADWSCWGVEGIRLRTRNNSPSYSDSKPTMTDQIKVGLTL